MFPEIIREQWKLTQQKKSVKLKEEEEDVVADQGDAAAPVGAASLSLMSCWCDSSVCSTV